MNIDCRRDFFINSQVIVGIVLVSVFLLALILSFFWSSISDQNFTGYLRLAPSFLPGGLDEFILGTDDLGRDVFSRLIMGARSTLGIAALVVMMACGIGCTFALFAGVLGSYWDRIISRLMDIIVAFPTLFLAIIIITILGERASTTVFALSLAATPRFYRFMAAIVRSEMSKPYIMAARSFEYSSLRIMFSEILPNCIPQMMVQISLGLSDAILDTSALGFLGLGVSASTAEWGTMLAESRSFIESSPWLLIFPGSCILLSVLGLNLLGEGLRDAISSYKMGVNT